MGANDRLREMLAERGVEYVDCGYWEFWVDENGVKWHSEEQLDGKLRLRVMTPLTPEQAIATTLRAGTCDIEEDQEELELIPYTPEDTWAYRCGACNWVFRYDRGIKPRFCPYCGRKAVGK